MADRSVDHAPGGSHRHDSATDGRRDLGPDGASRSGEPAESAVDNHVAELVSNCPGFLDHEYRQAYWQGLQNLRARTVSTASPALHS